MLLEITLTKDDVDFGVKGTKIMIRDGYVVGVSPHINGSKIFIDMSDVNKFKTLYVKESYNKWKILKLNP